MTFSRPRHLGMSLSCPSRAMEGPPPMTSAVAPSQSRENRIHVQAVDLLEGGFQRLPVLIVAGEGERGIPDHRGVDVLFQCKHLREIFDGVGIPQPVNDGELRERLVLWRRLWLGDVELAILVHPVPLGNRQIHLDPPQGGRHRERLIRDLRHAALFVNQRVPHASSSPPRYSMTTTTPAEPLRPSSRPELRKPPPTP